MTKDKRKEKQNAHAKENEQERTMPRIEQIKQVCAGKRSRDHRFTQYDGAAAVVVVFT